MKTIFITATIAISLAACSEKKEETKKDPQQEKVDSLRKVSEEADKAVEDQKNGVDEIQDSITNIDLKISALEASGFTREQAMEKFKETNPDEYQYYLDYAPLD